MTSQLGSRPRGAQAWFARSVTSGIVAAVALTAASPARADDKAVCLDAASKGQTLRDQHRLVEARDQFRVCARQVCPGVVQTECLAWLDQAEKALPTVVVTAKDASGGDLVKVKVIVDGHEVATSLDGTALPMNPGPHTFKFTGPDGSLVEQQVVVREGERGRAVGAVFLTVNVNMGDSLTPRQRTLRTAAFIVGGLGIIGIGVGAIAGGIATSDKSSAQCNGNVCLTGPLDSARSAAKASDVGFIAGGVLLAGGVGLFVASIGSSRPASALRLSPLVAREAGGVAIGGAW